MVSTNLLSGSARVAAGISLAAFGAACSVDAVAPLGPCNQPLSVSATPGAQDYYTWSPNCIASELIVLGAQTSQGAPVRWWIRSAKGFESGVFYGSVPQGATQFTQPALNPHEVGATVNIYGADGTRLGVAPLPAP